MNSCDLKHTISTLLDNQLIQLYQETEQKTGTLIAKCVNYLAEGEPPEEEYFKPDWHHSKFKYKNITYDYRIKLLK